MAIYVGNLSFEATKEDITEVFSQYGEISRVSLPTSPDTGRPRGFAFVEMVDAAKEDAAIQALDGAEWMGRDLKVNKAKPRTQSSGPRDSRGSSGGGWNKPRDRY